MFLKRYEERHPSSPLATPWQAEGTKAEEGKELIGHSKKDLILQAISCQL